MIHTRLLLVLVILALLGAILFGLLRDDPQTTTQSSGENALAEKLNFRLKWVFYSSFAQHFVAQEKGYFADENVDVDMRQGGAGLDPLKLVASGEDDVGLASYGQILIACEKGLPLVAIGQSNISSGVVFIALEKSGITTPQQFLGKKVGVIPGSDTGSVYEAVMTKQGLDRKKVDEIPIGFSVDPLLNGAVDVSTAAFSTNQPLFIESKGIPVNVIDPKDYGVSVGGNVFFTRADLIEKKPDLLRRFLKADLRGTPEALRMNDKEVLDIVLKYNPLLDRKAEQRIWEATKNVLLPKTFENLGHMPEATWEQTKDVFAGSGLISSDLDYSKCYTNKLVDAVSD